MKSPECCAYVYARVKATMTLRTTGDPRGASGLRHRRFRLPALLAATTALVLTMLAGGSSAGIPAYQGTLYLAGPASSISGSSWQLVTTTPAAQGATPVATAGVANTGGVPTGAYRYIYVTTNGGGARTASAVSNQPNVTNAPVTVTNVPVGAEVYRAKIPNSTNTFQYILLGTNPGPTTTYTDTSTATTGTLLPQADTRVAIGSAGWAPFSPGVSLGSSLANTAVGAATIPGSCTGWLVDSGGGMTFPAGTWTIDAQVRPDSNGNGAAALTAAVWKVDDSGNTVAGGTVVPPTDGGSFVLNGLSQTVSVSYTTSSTTTLATNEHLCVQFWRHQSTAYTSGGATSRTIAMLAWDPNNKISVHPAPHAIVTPTLSSPADGLHSQTIPTLAATYSNSEGDPGSLTIRVCADAGCSAPADSGLIAANNGDTKTWTPTGLGDGTYYWSAEALDSTGLASAWTSARTFVIDNVAPTTTVDSGPAVSSNATSGLIAFSSGESVTGFQCHIDAAAFAGCTSPYSYGPLTDGAHTFYVKAIADLAGNAGTTTTHAWTIDTVPPDTAIGTKPSPLSNSASPSFTFTATQVGSSFECNLDGAGFAACTSPKTYATVGDGAHTFQVRAIDPATNVDPSPDSYAWTIDATPPDTSIGPSKPASLTVATGATFDFSSNEAGSTFQCSLDGAAFSACSTPKTYSALGDGSHIFQVRATDTAANVDASPASHTWTVDTTPPVTSIGPTMPPANTSSASATFDLASNEAGSTFECRIDGGLYGSCTTPKTYTGLADGSHTVDVRATDPAGNVDTGPATYTWAIDNVAPSTPTLVSPADATLTNALPQLRATFNDATAGGDTGTMTFQVCSTSAPAGSACAPVVQSSTSGSVSNGGTASWTPAALGDGTYYWQARSQDAAGNLSGWSATRSFQLDTSVPSVVVSSPDDGAWVPRVELKATFNKPSFAGTGTVEFRVCSDALCLGVVRSGSSGTLVNGQQAVWSPATQPGDGLWYWQARSVDSVGNASAWSTARSLHLDSVAPAKPPHFNGQIAGDGLTLRWDAPNDVVANFVVFVNGAPWKNLGATEFEVKLGPFDVNDARTFSVVAVDKAGNVGAMSPVLVGVPSLIGLNWTQALGATSARGLALKRDGVAFASIPMFVLRQDPAAPALVERSSSVLVTMSAATGSPLAVRVTPGRVTCRRGCLLRLRVELSSAAQVRSRLLNGKGRLLTRISLGQLHAGRNTIRVRLPHRVGKGAYRLVLDASGDGGTAHAFVRVKVG